MIAPPPPYTCPRCWGVGHEDGDITHEDCVLCGARGHVDDRQLSGHFRLSELVRARAGYDQWPSVDALERLGELARHLLEPVRLRFGRPLLVSSAYRTPALDVVADHGNPYWLTHRSAHADGSAADVCPVTPDEGSDLRHTRARIMEIVRTTEGLHWDQAILEGGCVHLALYLPGGRRVQRHQLLVRCAAPAGSGRTWDYPQYLAGDDEQIRRCA